MLPAPRLAADEDRLCRWYHGLDPSMSDEWFAIQEIRHVTKIPYDRLRVALMRQRWTRRLDRATGVELWHGPYWPIDESETNTSS